ncbi:hypothetical protein [Sphingomonas solaris]|uniref:Uncharacterized protein n=1 Tax=Alterirhizorhabdus solaris TaxID=2529389 RepID=A0A558R847_9SPHN|nr:hypothetical protein [Sphingomonas solaris]TVV75547.1 hypothetical protein FOY91_06715 [Sphingomonas solaris]
MIPISTTEPARWTPPWRAAATPVPVYLLRAAGVVERELIEAELAGEHRAGAVYPFQLRAAFTAGVHALIGETAPEDAERLVQLIAQRDAAEGGEALSDDELALIAAAEQVMTEHYPAYRALIAQAQRREALAPVVAFQRLCVGWENVSAPYARDWSGVTPAAMAAIDPFELRVAGRAAYNMLYAGAQSGN